MREVEYVIQRRVLEDLLADRYGGERVLCPRWLQLVRRLPCAYPGCAKRPAGTAHHIWTNGTGWKCSDFLTIPLCIEHHVIGQDPVQEMNSDEFLRVFGQSESEVVRRTYTLLCDHIETGQLT